MDRLKDSTIYTYQRTVEAILREIALKKHVRGFGLKDVAKYPIKPAVAETLELNEDFSNVVTLTMYDGDKAEIDKVTSNLSLIVTELYNRLKESVEILNLTTDRISTKFKTEMTETFEMQQPIVTPAVLTPAIEDILNVFEESMSEDIKIGFSSKKIMPEDVERFLTWAKHVKVSELLESSFNVSGVTTMEINNLERPRLLNIAKNNTDANVQSTGFTLVQDTSVFMYLVDCFNKKDNTIASMELVKLAKVLMLNNVASLNLGASFILGLRNDGKRRVIIVNGEQLKEVLAEYSIETIMGTYKTLKDTAMGTMSLETFKNNHQDFRTAYDTDLIKTETDFRNQRRLFLRQIVPNIVIDIFSKMPKSLSPFIKPDIMDNAKGFKFKIMNVINNLTETQLHSEKLIAEEIFTQLIFKEQIFNRFYKFAEYGPPVEATTRIMGGLIPLITDMLVKTYAKRD